MSLDHINRIMSAIAECNRFIAKEEARDAALRPAETTELLNHYITHKAMLEGMLK